MFKYILKEEYKWLLIARSSEAVICAAQAEHSHTRKGTMSCSEDWHSPGNAASVAVATEEQTQMIVGKKVIN